MSQRKARQSRAREDYSANRAPGARWMAQHRTRCEECGKGNACRMVSAARARGMSI